MNALRRTLASRLLIALFALAFATTGFAHAPLAAPGPDLSAYALFDGSLPELCGSGGGQDDSGAKRTCDACRIMAAFLMPPRVFVPTERIAVATRIRLAGPEIRARAPQARPAGQPREPPIPLRFL